MNATKRIVTVSLLTASSLIAGLIESRFPLPFPGMRLGVANIFILTALLASGPADAAAVAAARLALSFIFSGNAAALLCSAGGIACSLPATIALYKLFPDGLSVPAISTAGAFAFNFGQIAAVAVALKTPGIFGYLPPLLLAAAVTGFSIGCAAEAVNGRLRRSNLIN
ncbi:MAG: Gx transporter family protein [Synergistaceae bacterium]|jgi:heptaprenyl diphosphate synthase|nr:Gx transporter family protein [Synergistaceae bacterium]